MAPKFTPCRMCGGEKDRDIGGRMRARYCKACETKRSIDYDMAHRLCDSQSEDHQRWSCVDCHRVKHERQLESGRRSAATRARLHPKLFRPENAERFWQSRAHSMVSSAIRCGFLPKLDGSIACTDCGGVANQYDHRDYGRPLDVDPVCASCNRRRGTAVWPERREFASINPNPTTGQAAA